MGRNIFRFLGFYDGPQLIILTNGFQKKSQKTPKREIELVKSRKQRYLKGDKEMDDLEKYISKRKKRSPEFAKDFESGYNDFKIGVMLKQAREKAGITQEDLARKMHTRKSAISRIENQSKDIRLSTLEKFAEAVGRQIKVEII
jgi:DNA-binding XRE family transcriptional regulator